MNPKLQEYLERLEKKMDTAMESLESKMKEVEGKAFTAEEKQAFETDTKALQAEIKSLQEALDEMAIKNDTVGTKSLEVQARKEFNTEFKTLVKESRRDDEFNFELKSIGTTEVSELGGIITKDEKNTNVIEFPQASLQFVNDLNEVTIAGKSITFVLEDPSFDSNFTQLTDDEIDAFWTSEGEEVKANGSEKFEEVKIETHKITMLITITNEMLDDAEFDIVAYIQRKMQQRFSFKQLIGFTLGTGIKTPKGFLKSNRVNIVPLLALTADTLWKIVIHLEHGISQEYRPGGKYYMHDDVWKVIKTFEDSDGRPLMVRGFNMIDATADTMNGKPVVMNNAMTTDITTAGAKPIAFANFKRGYTKVMRKALQFIIDKVSRKGFTLIYAEGRVGGDVTSKNAIALYEVTAP